MLWFCGLFHVTSHLRLRTPLQVGFSVTSFPFCDLVWLFPPVLSHPDWLLIKFLNMRIPVGTLVALGAGSEQDADSDRKNA